MMNYTNLPKISNFISNVSSEKILPNTYIKDGENQMVPLSWTPVNSATSYALICVDIHPIAKKWVHLYIPHIAFSKNKFNQTNVESGQSIIGKNSFGTPGYGGPQPPIGSGIHHYVFYLFALKDVIVDEVEKEKCRNVEDFLTNVVKDKKKILAYNTLSFIYENK